MYTYAVKHRNMDIRMASRSGGIFTALTDVVLDKGGVIYGCRLDEKFMAVHARAEDREGRDAFRESKYIQSDMQENFSRVKQDLSEGRTVLFSGTSCQVHGLYKYLDVSGCDTKNLILTDIVCHGVPSPMVWADYLEYVNSKHSGKIEGVKFRNKQKYGWKDHVETVTIDGTDYHSRIYTTLFYDHDILRPSCYKCPYKNINHMADITIADCWGIERNCPDFNDNKGVSLVLVNTQKGKELFDMVLDNIEVLCCDINDYLQPPLQKPFAEPKERKRFWKYYQNNSFSKVVHKYYEKRYNGFWVKVKRKINKISERISNGR